MLARASYVVVLADGRPTALLALASYAVVLADARPTAFLALASYATEVGTLTGPTKDMKTGLYVCR